MDLRRFKIPRTFPAETPSSLAISRRPAVGIVRCKRSTATANSNELQLFMQLPTKFQRNAQLSNSNSSVPPRNRPSESNQAAAPQNPAMQPGHQSRWTVQAWRLPSSHDATSSNNLAVFGAGVCDRLDGPLTQSPSQPRSPKRRPSSSGSSHANPKPRRRSFFPCCQTSDSSWAVRPRTTRTQPEWPIITSTQARSTRTSFGGRTSLLIELADLAQITRKTVSWKPKPIGKTYTVQNPPNRSVGIRNTPNNPWR